MRAYEALFDRYGVHRVDDLEQFSTALIMFAQPHAVGTRRARVDPRFGRRAAIADRSRARGRRAVSRELAPASVSRLESLLDPGLPAVNPLDAWSTGGPDYHVGMQQCFATLMADPGAALGAVVHDRVAGGGIHASYLDYLRAGHAASGKPAFLVANTHGTAPIRRSSRPRARDSRCSTDSSPFLRGARCLLDQRDFVARQAAPAPQIPERDPGALARAVASTGRASMSTTPCSCCWRPDCPPCATRIVNDEREARAAAQAIGAPVVLKTAQRGIDHKSDVDGVRLGLVDADDAAAAYRELAARIGPRALVAPMVRSCGRRDAARHDP